MWLRQSLELSLTQKTQVLLINVDPKSVSKCRMKRRSLVTTKNIRDLNYDGNLGPLNIWLYSIAVLNNNRVFSVLR